MMESLADKRIQREREAMEAIVAEEEDDEEYDGEFICNRYQGHISQRYLDESEEGSAGDEVRLLLLTL